MKKALLSMLMVASCFGVANAQLVVDENGHIGMNIHSEEAIKSNVGINTLGSSTSSMSIVQDAIMHSTGLNMYRVNQFLR